MAAMTMTEPNANPHRRPRGGFTLIELLIVMGLIVLLIALAVPTFSFITGTRSTDAAQNVIAAMLGRARSEAVTREQVAGVLFFRDRAAERNAMAIVLGPASSKGVSDYSIWTDSTSAGKTITYRQGDEVYVLQSTPAAPTGEGKAIVRKFVCIGTEDLGNGEKGIADSTVANAPPDFPTASNVYWAATAPASFALLPGADLEYLPPGVGAQIASDLDMATPQDRYLQTGMVLFDRSGQLVVTPYEIAPNTPLARLVDSTGDVQIPAATDTRPMLSGTAMALFEREPWLNNGNEQDFRFAVPSAPTGSPSADESEEEEWISSNALFLLVNRYNGTLTRGE
ncbi:MAG TPA: prepilin-type N-terminal cleavage/methylation domain-containing protein [Tepidisphaeraceae bacterium]|nr:prepilin-type N-terminal cleavage/methylation domain-containing protein [Tepidisphaeraceae bacterium]